MGTFVFWVSLPVYIIRITGPLESYLLYNMVTE